MVVRTVIAAATGVDTSKPYLHLLRPDEEGPPPRRKSRTMRGPCQLNERLESIISCFSRGVKSMHLGLTAFWMFSLQNCDVCNPETKDSAQNAGNQYALFIESMCC
jgi:hypothetical protein